MTSQEYLYEQLMHLHKTFNFTTIKYEYFAYTNTHIIEVIPFQTYNSESYMECEYQLEQKFTELFPMEELLFVSNDSLVRVKNPIFEIKPEQVVYFESDFNEEITNTEIDNSFENNFNIIEDTNYALAA